MYKVAFAIKLKAYIDKITWDKLENGNPGIGGTQYLFLMVVFALRKRGYKVFLYSDVELNKYEIMQYKNNKELIELCCRDKIEKLVLNAYGRHEQVLNDKRLLDNNTKIILWAHNSLDYFLRRKIVKSINRPTIVCVSKSQYKAMQKTGLGSITTYVNNFISKKFYNESKVSTLKSKKVVYIGALMPNKGCHNLLRIWKKIIAQEPDAKLIIIGGSSVYGSKIKKGFIGVTDKAYEMIFRYYIKQIKKKESIHFVGEKSWMEIPSFISDARVGIVNPSYFRFDETFCMSAVELESYGIPVVSRYRKDGLSATVMHNVTGFLYSKDKEISEAVLRLLKDDALCSNLSQNARSFAKTFLDENSIDKWEALLLNNKNNYDGSVKNCFCKDDFIRMIDDAKILVYKVIRRLVK